MIEFEAWPKIARLNRDIVITEKIDGTNAAIVIEEVSPDSEKTGAVTRLSIDGRWYDVAAQSRTRLITPEQDNYGFAGYVQRNAATLVLCLGPGRHYGEWWGAGIQRKYNMDEKRFSLFNTSRWKREDVSWVSQLDVVPVLHQGPYSDDAIGRTLYYLREGGSRAAPGFMNPEGIVVFHTAANLMFKVTLVGDEKPKGSKE